MNRIDLIACLEPVRSGKPSVQVLITVGSLNEKNMRKKGNRRLTEKNALQRKIMEEEG